VTAVCPHQVDRLRIHLKAQSDPVELFDIVAFGRPCKDLIHAPSYRVSEHVGHDALRDPFTPFYPADAFGSGNGHVHQFADRPARLLRIMLRLADQACSRQRLGIVGEHDHLDLDLACLVLM